MKLLQDIELAEYDGRIAILSDRFRPKAIR